MNIPNSLIITNDLIEDLDYYSVAPTNWRIKWRGKFLKVRSGKTMWLKESHARSAFRNHLMYGNTPFFLAKENGHPVERCHWREETKHFIDAAIKQLEAAGEIQFVND